MPGSRRVWNLYVGGAGWFLSFCGFCHGVTQCSCRCQSFPAECYPLSPWLQPCSEMGLRKLVFKVGTLRLKKKKKRFIYYLYLSWFLNYELACSGKVKLKVKKVSCSVVSDSLWPCGLWPTRFLCPWNFPGQNTGVGCYFLLQGIFLTQGLNPGLPLCRQILYHLNHQGS